MKGMKEATYPMYKNTRSFDSVREAFDLVLNETPNNVGCRYIKEDQVISKSYQEVFNEMSFIGSYMYEQCGFAKDKVAIISESTYEWYVSYMAALYYGVVAVPLDRQLSEKDLFDQIQFSDVKIIFFSNKYMSKVRKLKEMLKGKVSFVCLEEKTDFCLSYMDILASQKVISELHSIKTNDLAEIVFTSGTTGTSKGVMISHGNIASVLLYCLNAFNLNERDQVISFLPNNHLYFLSMGLLLPMCFNGAVCLNDSVLKFKQHLMMYKPSVVFMVPAMLQLLKREILSCIGDNGIKTLSGEGPEEAKDVLKAKVKELMGGNISTLMSGGAFLNQETIDFYRLVGVEIMQGYGVSECAPLISCYIQKRVDYSKIGSVGLVGTCCSAKIVDGEICISGPNVMLGYYKNPEKTEEAMDGEWLKTGDLGYIDEDGYLYITGRKKNLIILSNGENVCPEEIENLIYAIGEVDSAIVYATNELIVAEIYPNKARIVEKNISNTYEYLKQEIKKINTQLPQYKQIKRIELRDEPFEMTSTMKIKH